MTASPIDKVPEFCGLNRISASRMIAPANSLRNSRRLAAMPLLIILFTANAWAGPKLAAIASAHPLATQAGFEILDQGGNAFDAAVAVSAALAVVEPAGSGLGGGGFWLLKRAADGKEIMLDGREKAPLAAHADMYLNAEGKVIPALSNDGAMAAAIPGMPAALAELAQRYGRLPLAKSLRPAIRIAESGFEVGGRYLRAVKSRAKALQNSPAAAAIFLDQGEVPSAGFRLVQHDLAATLKRIAQQGRAGFYQGETATKLVDEVRKAGGIWRLEDLRAYQVAARAPLHGEYRGIRITAAPPPSSGGVALLEALNVLSAFDLAQAEPVAAKHLIIEAERRAYRDRAIYLGDPDFIDIPVKRLTSPDYAAGLAVAIRPDRVMPSQNLADAAAPPAQGDNTTHFSILDRQGNQVAATLSINQSFGSGFVAAGTGVLLNDEMDDFSASPGQPNSYGLVGAEANKIEPGKRMLSSMSPTFLETQNQIAILGTPGGSRIISMVLLGILDFAVGHEPQSWVSTGRFHHQYLPDVVEYEPGGLNETEIHGLESLGHQLKSTPARYGDMQAILWDKRTPAPIAASDPRGEGLAEVR
jgi:gamma-glutamyltranspeptidase/glutathione hydrolase